MIVDCAECGAPATIEDRGDVGPDWWVRTQCAAGHSFLGPAFLLQPTPETPAAVSA